MIIPRIGAICLLIGFGFAVAQVGRLMYVTAREGYSSWIPVALLLAPTAILGLASAILVLRRRPLGIRLAWPFCGLLVITAVITFFGFPPVGEFLDDYEQAALARGVTVPPYLAEQGMGPEEYVESETKDVRAEGAIGSIALALVYAATVARGGRARIEQLTKKRKARPESQAGTTNA
jgi:hypothetical protein